MGLLFYGLPNIINSRESGHFDLEENLYQSRQEIINSDTVVRSASTFYQRGAFVKFLFGEHYRDVWSIPITVKVFKGFDSLEFHKVGGGMQTTSIEVRDSLNRSYTIRTLDKDQARVLPNWLYPSALRLLLRDQTSALNPYGSLVVAELSEQLDIYHTNPQLVYIPFNQDQHDSINFFLSGKITIIEEEPGSKWKGDSKYDNPVDILNTAELFEFTKTSANYSYDTLGYLRCRLFDLLISDWDRHSHQWKWVVLSDSLKTTIKPFPIDRDMAFCRFDDGFVNTCVVNISNKFKSYRQGESILDAAQKTTDLDQMFLSGLSSSDFKKEADLLIEILGKNYIKNCFRQYPEEVYKEIGIEQYETFRSRLQFLNQAAEDFRNQIITE